MIKFWYLYRYPKLYYLCLLIRTDKEANNVPSQSFPWLGILLLMHSCIHQGLSGTRMWIVTAGLSTQRKSKWDSDSQRSCQFFHFPTKNSSDPNIMCYCIHKLPGFSQLIHPPKKLWFPLKKWRISTNKNTDVPSKKWDVSLKNTGMSTRKLGISTPTKLRIFTGPQAVLTGRASCTRSSLPRINGSGRFTAAAAVAVVSRHRISGRSRDEEIHLERTWHDEEDPLSF